jgi:hypothetical protein
LPIAQVVFVDLSVDRPRKEMVNRARSHVIANSGVPLLQKLLGKSGRAFSRVGASKIEELAQGEVSGVDCHNIKEASFGLRVAEFPDPFDVVEG